MDLTINNGNVSLVDEQGNFFDTTKPEWFNTLGGIISMSSNLTNELISTYGSEQFALEAAQQTATDNPGLSYPQTFNDVASSIWLLAFMSCLTSDS